MAEDADADALLARHAMALVRLPARIVRAPARVARVPERVARALASHVRVARTATATATATGACVGAPLVIRRLAPVVCY